MWESCWSAARYNLRLADWQFGELTPRQFYLLLDRHREEVDLQKTLAGIISSAVANFGYCQPKKPLCPADFVGGEPAKVERRSRKQIASNVREFFNRKLAQQNGHA